MKFNPTYRHNRSWEKPGRNPFRKNLTLQGLQIRILNWFTDTSSRFFEDNAKNDSEGELELTLIRKERINSMEWDLRQTTVQVLARDFSSLSQAVVPHFLRSMIEKLRRQSLIFFSLDDIHLQEESNNSKWINAAVLQLGESVDKVVRFNEKMLHGASRGVIHFSVALKIFMLRSMHRLKKVPSYFSGIQRAFPGYAPGLIKGAIHLSFSLVKKILDLISYKRN